MRQGGLRRLAGFTLLELIVVMVIGGMIVALAPPLIARVIPSVEMKATAQNLAAALRYTRNRAISERREASLLVDLEAREYRMIGMGKSRKIPEGIELELLSAEAEGFSEQQSVYTFFPSGGSTGGRITFSRGESGYDVDVDWLTGRVRIIE